MAEKSLNDVSRDLREMYQKGKLALDRQNYDYAITFFTQVLQREPGLFEVRKALRATQFKKSGGSTSFFRKVVGGASSSPLVAKAQLSLRKSPLEALAIAEQILTSDPSNSSAHRIVAEAAMAANLPQTASLSLEILLKNSGRDYDLMMDLGRAFTASGQIEKAEAIYTELQRTHPNRPQIQEALKNLSANRTMKEQGYEALSDGSGSYRDILRNPNEAVSLEQEKRSQKGDSVADQLIAEYEDRLTREPLNLKLVRNIAELYVQKKEFDRALEYYGRVQAGEAGADASLEKAISETILRRFEHQISQVDPSTPEGAAKGEELKMEKAAYQLAECQKRAERYPTDLQIRFELGQLYFQNGKLNEAIQEFQKSQNNPNRRLQSICGLGQCFAAGGKYDMAARKFQDALKEKPGFDDEKKELHYLLGSVLEKIGKREEAIEQFKIIYEQDLGYKDVAAKVDASYRAQ